MLHVSDSKLYSIRQQVIRQLPLPEEMTVQLDADRLEELLRTIESAADGEDFNMLVARLPRRQLNELFGLLLVVESSASAHSPRTHGLAIPTDDAPLERERIYCILERRATLSLAQTGWAFYQQHYFHAELAEAMNRISQALVARGEKAPFMQHCHKLGCNAELPARIASLWVEELAKPIHVLNRDWTLSSALKEIEALGGSRFTTVLLHAFFTRCPLERTAAEAAHYAMCLEQATTEEQAQLLSALYGEYRMEPMFNAVSQVVLKTCGLPRKGNDHPVWASVSQQVRQHFRQWALIDMLSQHTTGQVRKQAFYQPLLMRIFDCSLLSPDVLLLEFPQFFIVDHKDFSHQAVYYDRTTMDLAREAKATPEDLAIVYGQIHTAREIILDQIRSNKVLLKFEEVNLLYARDFIDSMLNPVKRSSVI